MSVKLPVLLNSSLQETAILYPTKGSLKINASGTSEAQLTLSDKSASIPMHGWVKLWNQHGFVGYFRRTSRNNNVTVDKSVTLRHGIDILNDSVWEADEDFTGTLTEYITAILNHQTSLINGVKPWVLGTCAKSANVSKSIHYDNLMDLLEKTVDAGENYYFVYNQNVWPWQISLVAKPSGVLSEFRLNRNIEKCKISDNDSELCTRLILNVNKVLESSDPDTQDVNQSVWRVYNDTAGQAAYGIITKTADIDVTQDTLPGGPFPEADAWAAAFFANRAAPQLQIQIDGLELKKITGLDWDESRICELCRVALPEYSESIEQRVVTITYPDLYKHEIPQRITVSLANVLPSYTSSLSSLSKETNVLASENRYTERYETSFNKRFAIYDKQGNILNQAGLMLDAYGMLVYADDGVNMIGSRFEVQANKIGMVVGTIDGANYIKAVEIVLAINESTGESEARINADHVYINATDDVKAWAAGTDASLVAQSAAIQTITANYITADNISSKLSGSSVTIGGSFICNSLTVGNQAIGNANITSLVTATQLTDGSVKFTGYRPSGTSYDIGTFSRASGSVTSLEADNDSVSYGNNNYNTLYVPVTAKGTNISDFTRSVTVDSSGARSAGYTAGRTYEASLYTHYGSQELFGLNTATGQMYSVGNHNWYYK